MKSKDIFSLAVRLLGLWFVYLGFTNLPMVFVDTSKVLPFVVCYFAVAWWLIGGALLLVSRAYPDLSEESQEASEITEEASAKTDA